MKRKLKEANYNLSINDLNTNDGDALSQILAMASQAENNEVMGDEVITDPYANEFEDGLDNGVAVDEPFNMEEPASVDYEESMPVEDDMEYDFSDDFAQYGITEDDLIEPVDNLDGEVLSEASETKGYSVMVKDKEYAFLPTENEYSDEEIKNQFLKQYMIEKGEEFPYIDEIVISRKGENVSEDIVLSKDMEDPTQVAKLDESWVETADENEPHEDWTNAQTWSVALDIDNNRDLYEKKVEFAQANPDATYMDFVKYAGLSGKRTEDGVSFTDKRLDVEQLTKDCLQRDIIRSIDENCQINEEYGNEYGNPDMEEISNSLSKGNAYGDTSGYTYNLLVNGEEVWQNICFDQEVYEWLLNQISYPVADGHTSYDGLDLIFNPYSMSEIIDITDENIQDDLIRIGFDESNVKELAKKGKDTDEEIETWIDYDINYEPLESEDDEIEDEYEADDEMSEDEIDEQINEALRNAGVESADTEWKSVRKNAMANPNLYGGRYTDKDSRKAKRDFMRDREEKLKSGKNKAVEMNESAFSPKFDEKKKAPTRAKYQDVNINADGKSASLGFQDNANPSQHSRSNKNKPAKIVETAKRLIAKANGDKKDKLQTRFIYKLMNEGISYSNAKKLILGDK